MKKSFMALMCVCIFASTGFSTEEVNTNLQYLQGSANDPTLIEMLPALKEVAQEDFIAQFKYASTRLLDMIKENDRISSIVDITALKEILHQRADMIVNNDLSELKGKSFTEITLPLLSCEKSDLNKIKEFILWHEPLRKIMWYAPYSLCRSIPNLNFVSDTNLLWRIPVIKISEQTLATIMFGIEKDIFTNPSARTYNVPANTRLLFDLFKKCEYNDNVPEKKIAAYQKYLTKEQNNILSLQLLSIYLENPLINDFGNYIPLLGQSLFLNIKAFQLIQFVDARHNALIPLLQSYLHNEIKLSVGDKNNIDTFVTTIMNKKVINNNKTILFKNICSETINKCFQNPLISRFKKLEKEIADEDNEISKNTKKVFKLFVETMNKGCSCVLTNVLNHMDYQNIAKMYKVVGLKIK